MPREDLMDLARRAAQCDLGGSLNPAKNRAHLERFDHLVDEMTHGGLSRDEALDLIANVP